MDAIRSFVAIELSRSIQQQLETLIGKLKSPRTQAVRWVPTENIHLTIKFLGDVSPKNMDLLKNMLKAEVSRQHSFSLTIGGMGAFPTAKRPRVIWVGITAPPQFISLVHLVEAECNKLGYANEERPFSPHLTLGRVSQVRQVAEALAGLTVGQLGTAEVREVILFKSELRPSGVEYAPLLKVPLRAAVP